jgi:hypothetical protein
MGVGDGVVVGGSGQARQARFQFDIAPRKKAGEVSAELVNIRQ